MRSRGRRWSGVLFAMTLVVALSGEFGRTASAEKGKTAKQIYDGPCASCHRKDGTGKASYRNQDLTTEEKIKQLKEFCEIPPAEEAKLRVKRNQPDFTDAEWKKRYAADKAKKYTELKDIVKNGKKVVVKVKCKDPDTKKVTDEEVPFVTEMPGHGHLSDDQIIEVLDYIGTLEKPKP